jgi:non-canonical (house-cleaning) NTP pyrophosphatase
MIKTRKLQPRHLLFTLGSKNSHKFLALYRALEQLPLEHPESYIETANASSLVNQQPFGPEETLRGARNRAIFAEVHRPNTVAIGIENGLFAIDDEFADCAVIVARIPGIEIVEISDGVNMPKKIVEETRRRGFEQVTAGQVLAALCPEADPNDPHRFLTDGQHNRVSLLVPALLRAIRQIIKPPPRLIPLA